MPASHHDLMSLKPTSAKCCPDSLCSKFNLDSKFNLENAAGSYVLILKESANCSYVAIGGKCSSNLSSLMG
jgi:hypothetical protein